MKRFGFGKRYCLDRNFIKRSAIVMNARTNTQYFKLERGACQGDPVLEILFLFIKKHPEIKGIKIFKHCFLHAAYAGYSMFFSERCTIH